MSRLIDAETVKEQVKLYFNKFARDGLKTEIIERATNDIAEVIDNVPTVDTERHGYWRKVDDKEPLAWDCSVCGAMCHYNTPYCPICGAKMDLVDQHTEE